ncbi:MAG: hypothetical protein RXR41_00855 [Candidatus Marsarchaeota archaeon]
MRVEKKGAGDAVITVESFDDLWRLSLLVKPGYLVAGRTSRQLKLRDEGGEVRGKRRLSLKLAVRVEKVEFQPFTESMRFLGRVEGVEEGMEWAVQRGEHHALSVGVGDQVEIRKDGEFDALEEKLLREGGKGVAQGPLALLVSLDMSSASLAVLWSYGVERLLSISSQREEEDAHLDEFFSDVESAMAAELQKRDIRDIIISGPGVVLAEFKKHIDRKGRFSGKKLNFKYITSSYGGDEGLELLLSSPDLKEYAQSIRLLRERELIQGIFEGLSSGHGVAVGLEEVEKSAEEGRVKVVLISSRLLYDPPAGLMEIIQKVKESGGDVELLSEEGGRELVGLGGIAALLW